MNCKICGEPVILSPSATERSQKDGKSPAYYTRLFPTHSSCALAKRAADTKALIQRRTRETHGMTMSQIHAKDEEWPRFGQLLS